MLIRIRERNERVIETVQLRLMNATNGPLARALETTADALTARHIQPPDDRTTFDKRDRAVRELPGGLRVIARHGLEANATTHHTRNIHTLGALGLLAKLASRLGLRDRMTGEGSHDMLREVRRHLMVSPGQIVSSNSVPV